MIKPTKPRLIKERDGVRMLWCSGKYYYDLEYKGIRKTLVEWERTSNVAASKATLRSRCRDFLDGANWTEGDILYAKPNGRGRKPSPARTEEEWRPEHISILRERICDDSL